eukprot:951125-Pleurochrysis_carterae.AAC.1
MASRPCTLSAQFVSAARTALTARCRRASTRDERRSSRARHVAQRHRRRPALPCALWVAHCAVPYALARAPPPPLPPPRRGRADCAAAAAAFCAATAAGSVRFAATRRAR